MSKSYSISNSKRTGIESSKNFLPRIESTALGKDAESGLSRQIFIKKTDESLASAVVVRPRCAASAMANGMEPRTVPRTRKRIVFLLQQKKLDGNAVIAAEQWLS